MVIDDVSDEVKQQLIEKHQDINVDHEWWDYVYDTFTEDMREKGIEVVRMYFSGFYSQGDGACFEGLVPVSKFGLFMDAHGLSDKFPAARYFSDNADLRFDVYKMASMYCHESTVTGSIYDITGNPYDEGSPRWEVYDTMQTLFETEYELLEVECLEIVRGYMQDLYSRLRKEYEYLSSPEAVWETIVANDLHKQAA